MIVRPGFQLRLCSLGHDRRTLGLPAARQGTDFALGTEVIDLFNIRAADIQVGFVSTGHDLFFFFPHAATGVASSVYRAAPMACAKSAAVVMVACRGNTLSSSPRCASSSPSEQQSPTT